MARLTKRGNSAPVVCLNGSGFENLDRNSREMLAAVQNAIDVMALHCPHPRDHQIHRPHEDSGFELAQRQHATRLAALLGVLDDLRDLRGDLLDQTRHTGSTRL